MASLDWNKLEIRKKVCLPGSPEGIKFDIFPFGFFLMLRYSDPDGNIRRQIKQGYSYFRAVQAGSFLLFLSRFGASPWRIAVFHISEAQCKRVPQPWIKRGLPLHIIFVDADTGLLQAKKVEELDPELTRRVVSIVSAQDPDDPLLNRDIFLRRILRKYTPEQLAALANLKDRVY